MRIGINAHLCSPSSSYRNAGVSRYIRQLLEAISRRAGDDEMHLFASHDEFPESYILHRSAYNTENPRKRIAWEQLTMPLAIKRLKLDVLHSPMHVLPAVCPCRSVVTIHDLSFIRYPESFPGFQRRYLHFGTQHAVEKADVVVTVSQSTKRDVVELLGIADDKVLVTHLGVDSCYHPVRGCQQEDVASRYGVSGNTVLYLGTLEPRKNVPMLIRAFSLARKNLGSDVKLILSGGNGWFYEQIYQMVDDLGLKDCVHFTGYIPDEDLPALYSSATVFVYPSLYEGFGLPPLEAMACGTPVIVSNTSSLPEVVGEAGITVDPENAEELAHQITRVITDNSLRNVMTSTGLQQAALFTWDKTADLTLAAYKRASSS